MSKYVLSEIDLFLFDGEGGEAPAAGQGGSEAETGVANPSQNEPIIEGKTVDVGAEFNELVNGKYREEYDKRVQEIVKKRLKGYDDLKTKTGKIDKVTKLLMQKYDVQTEDEVFAKLEEEAIQEVAYKNDMTPEKYKDYLDKSEKAEKYEETVQAQLVEQQRAARVAKWRAEEAEFQKEVPDFKLNDHISNDQFISLLMANIPVKTAYAVLNLDKIIETSEQSAAEATIKDIQAKGNRPKETALSNKDGKQITKAVSDMTPSERKELAERARRGEKITL